MAPSNTAAEPYLPPSKRDVKLRYIPEHQVLLCTQCGYCVLHRALDRHLKAIHHLPAADRKHHLAAVQDYNIANLEDVSYPEEGSAPIPGLPVFDGYSCGVEGCSYRCVTNKRMQAHWRSGHAGEDDLYCARVRLQTFFRGNSLRYFVVAGRVTDDRIKELHGPTQTDTLAVAKPLSRTSAAPVSACSPTAITVANNGVDAAIQLPTPESVSLTIDLPAPDDSLETAIEWLLTRQFCDENYKSLQPVKGSRLSWRDEMLQACSEADFLRFAILSLSANYIAISYPDSREFYGQEAGRYRDLAVSALANRVSAISTENFFAVFNFTRLITLCCLAGIQLNKLEGSVEDASAGPIVPEWFPIQHQGKALIWPLRGDGIIIRAMHGPWEPLATSNQMPEYDLSNNPYDSVLEDLELALKALPDGTVDDSCLQALNMLRRVWTTPYRDGCNSFRDMALMWATRIPYEYLELAEAGDPIALIVFAHYWALWGLSEDHYWYMKGHAETMLLRVVQRLALEWQGWIEWPVTMIFGADLSWGSLESDDCNLELPKVPSSVS